MIKRKNKTFVQSLGNILATLTVVSVAACNMSPDYKRPSASIATEWPIGPAYGPPPPSGITMPPQAYNVGWKVFFRDPVLSQLISMSLANNRDLRESIENIAASRANYIQQRAEIFPTINAGAGATYQGIPSSVQGVSGGKKVQHFNELQTGFGISNYELDLFDHVRSLARAARESYLAQQENTISLQISLISEVANSYMAWLADMECVRIIHENVVNRENNLRLIQGLRHYGQQNAQAVAQAVELVQQARSQEQVYLRTAAADMTNLVLLVGQPIPQEILQRAGNNPSLNNFVAMPEVSAGMPSDLLERRPDIRVAEHQIKEANANVGYARAAFFPSIELTTSGGTASSRFAGMFGPYSALWQFAPSISVPLMDEGKNLAQLRSAKAKLRAAVAHYQKTVQSAFKDVSDALAARNTLKEKLIADRATAKASEQDYNLSYARFRNGIDSFLSALVAQNTMLTAQISAVQSHLQYLQSLSTLYRTLGGGWSEDNPTQSSTKKSASSVVMKRG